MEEPCVVKGVDHVVVRVNQPEPLFSILTQQLLLPQAWPLNTTPFFTSGGVHLGNLNLEVLHVGSQLKPARLYGLALELEPYETSLPELEKRNIPHTPPMPFIEIDDQGWQVTAWNNVYLGGLMGGGTAARVFFPLSQRAPKERWEQGSRPTSFNRRFTMPWLYDHVYPRGMIFSVEYNRVWRAAHITQDPTRAGLDVLRVYEVTIGVKNYPEAYARWKALLNPHPEVTKGVWEMPGGPRIHLVGYKLDGLRRIILQVSSLNRAAQFLNKREMLGKEKNGMLSIDPHKIQGLDIRLVQ